MSAVKWHHESRGQCYAKFRRVTVKSNHRKRRGVWSKPWPLPAGVRQHPAQTCSCGCRLRTAYRFREYQGYFCYTRLKLSFPPYTTLPLQVYFDILSYLTNLKAFFHHLRFSFLFVFDPSSSPTGLMMRITSNCRHQDASRFTGWAKKRSNKLMIIIMSKFNRLKNPLKDSVVNLQLNAY